MTNTPNLPVVRALIADDERLVREQLQARLAECWPELQICAVARDGLEAVRLAAEVNPDVVFLDIRMPGLTGIEAARDIVTHDSWHGEVVFVTAYDEYAVTAFEEGAVDYLLKPVEKARLAVTVNRLRARLKQPDSLDHQGALLNTLTQLQARLNGNTTQQLRWLQCGVGNTTRLVNVEDVLFFRSDEKYTRVQLAQQEAFIRTPIRELVTQLDPQQFWQIHRSTIVNLSAVAAVQRDDTGRQRVSLKQHPEVLEISRGFSHLFRAV
jgi:DNA-binding LytR/AlgR family response regulator